MAKGKGRPSSYNEKIANAICDLLAIGRSVLQIAAGDGFPHERTIYRWLEENESFRHKYVRAREFQAEHYAAQIVDLSDKPVPGQRVTILPDGTKEITIIDAVERTKLQIDARKWYAARLNPRKYGDKVVNEHSGLDGGPIDHSIKVVLVRPDPQPIERGANWEEKAGANSELGGNEGSQESLVLEAPRESLPAPANSNAVEITSGKFTMERIR